MTLKKIRFRMATNAVGVEKEAPRGIRNGIKDLFGLIGRERWSSKDFRCRHAAALRDRQTRGRDGGILAGNRVEIVGVRFGNNTRVNSSGI